MARVIPFLTRTRGSFDKSSRIGAADLLAYGYLVLGVLIILVPVLWTFVSSLKPERAIDSFDTRILPIAQVEADVEGEGRKTVWHNTAPDGSIMEVFKAGPTRRMTVVAPLDAPEDVFQAPRDTLAPSEEIRVATENYLDPILKRNGQENFTFGIYLFNS
ncbi:MAG: carbohydrate ABC transporter permease, partial [Pseudomonadota bacterium]